MPADLTKALEALVRRVVRAELQDALAPRSGLPALLTADQLAHQLGVSVATIRRLRSDGLPTVMVGESPRFRLEAVLTWFATRATKCSLRAVK